MYLLNLSYQASYEFLLKTYDGNPCLYFLRGLSFKCAPISSTSQLPQFGYVVEFSIYQPNTTLLKFGKFDTRSMPPSFTSFIARQRPRSFCLRDVWHATETCALQFGGKSTQREIKSAEIHFSCFDEFDYEDDPELVRRRKIGMANKGKVPWNKGKKHSAETRERIRQRTIEALRDPKVKSC